MWRFTEEVVIADSEKKCKCQLCYRRFKYDIILQEHIVKVHKEDFDKLDKPFTPMGLAFECVKCELKLILVDIREYHDHFEHREISRVQLCYKRFTKQSHLTSHHETRNMNSFEMKALI